MSYIGNILAAFLVLAVVGCSSPSFFRASSLSSNIQDVNVTSIVISKKNRRMYLFDGKTVLRSYKIGLGSEPVGDKKVQGDGKTPKGFIISTGKIQKPILPVARNFLPEFSRQG